MLCWCAFIKCVWVCKHILEWAVDVRRFHSKMFAGCPQSQASPFPQPPPHSASALWGRKKKHTLKDLYNQNWIHTYPADCSTKHSPGLTHERQYQHIIRLPSSLRAKWPQTLRGIQKLRAIKASYFLHRYNRNTQSSQKPVFNRSIC